MKLSYRDIFKMGMKISGGWGFWGSRSLTSHADRDDLIRAWVDALRAKGFSDMDIILYGDWKDARHIADNIYENTDYATFKKMVQSQSRGAREVAEVNQNEYPDDVLEMLREATGSRISRITASVVASTRQSRIARESPYSGVIKPILLRMGRRDIDPRHVEAYMTMAHRTLDGLSQQQFTREMLDIVEAIDANPRQAEQLADSYGL